MTENTEESGEERGERRESLFFLFVVLAVMAIAYAPLVREVWGMGARTTQAVNALVLLGAAFGDALRSVLKTGRFRPTVNAHGVSLFTLSCFSLAAASLTGVWPFAVLGLCLNAGALLSCGFGREGARAFYPALAGVGAMVMMLVLVPQWDQWLRVGAGRVSAQILPVLGIRADLMVRPEPFQVCLVAEKGAGVFNVATECNGLGILLSCVVLAVIVSLRRRVPAAGVAGLIVAAAVIGLVFNVIRITAIATATLRTDIPYAVIHEGLGTAIYLAALGVVLALVAGKRKKPRNADKKPQNVQ